MRERERVQGAPELEGSDRLQVLELEVEVDPAVLRLEANERCSQDLPG
jgi:hypothetical protein